MSSATVLIETNPTEWATCYGSKDPSSGRAQTAIVTPRYSSAIKNGNVPRMSLRSGPGRHLEVNTALVRLIDIGRIPMHLDRAGASSSALRTQIGRHLDGEVLLALVDGHRVAGVDVPLGEVGGDDCACVGGEADDGYIRDSGVWSDDGED